MAFGGLCGLWRFGEASQGLIGFIHTKSRAASALHLRITRTRSCSTTQACLPVATATLVEGNFGVAQWSSFTCPRHINAHKRTFVNGLCSRTEGEQASSHVNAHKHICERSHASQTCSRHVHSPAHVHSPHTALCRSLIHPLLTGARVGWEAPRRSPSLPYRGSSPSVCLPGRSGWWCIDPG